MDDHVEGVGGTTKSRDIEIPKDPPGLDGLEVKASDALIASAAQSISRLDFLQLSSICSTVTLGWVCSTATQLPSPQGTILFLVFGLAIFVSPAFHRYLHRS